MNLPDPKTYRSTMGLCLGLREGLASAVVVLSCRRTDPARTLYVTHEWERHDLNVDAIAEELKHSRKAYHTVFTCGYYGGRDEEKIFQTLSVRLGQHVEPAPHDPIVPLKLVTDDLRSGRLKVRPDSLVARDAKAAIWRDGVPDNTGVLTALRCAHWAAQQYRQRLKAPPSAEEKNATMAGQRKRRRENPY